MSNIDRFKLPIETLSMLAHKAPVKEVKKASSIYFFQQSIIFEDESLDKIFEIKQASFILLYFVTYFVQRLID